MRPAAIGQYNPDLNHGGKRVPHGLPPHRPLDADQRLQARAEQRRARAGRPLAAGRAFEIPANLTTSAELDLFLKGLSVEIQEELDLNMVDGMRRALLDAFDIQRARDHGIPDYNTLREAYGLPRVTSFAEITSDVDAQTAIAAVYPNINTIDPFVGALAEDHLPGANVGPLVAAGFRLQFERSARRRPLLVRTRPGPHRRRKSRAAQTRLSDIIRRNTSITNLQENVFFVPEPGFWPMMFGAVVPFIKWRRLRPLRVSDDVSMTAPAATDRSV